MTHDQLQHARLWRLENMPLLFPVTPVDIRGQVLAISDPSYVTGLGLGLRTTALSLGVLAVLAGRERRSRNAAS